jgi:DNA-binding NarL/FixJ family response regulator
MMEKIRILIVEDNKFIRNGWEIALQKESDFLIIGSYGSCEDAFKDEAINSVNVVLMDIGLPGISGIEGVQYLKENYPKIIIVMCTVHDDDDKIFDALCAGAVGYLLKKTKPEELISSLRDAYKGGSPMTPSVARKVIASFQKKSIAPSIREKIELTEREEEILALMAKGKSYPEIANEIFLSLDGVTYHIRHIYEKLHVHTRAEAVAKGIKKRLIQPPR